MLYLYMEKIFEIGNPREIVQNLAELVLIFFLALKSKGQNYG